MYSITFFCIVLWAPSPSPLISSLFATIVGIGTVGIEHRAQGSLQ